MASATATTTATYIEDKPLTPTPPFAAAENALGRRPRILVVNDDGVQSAGLKKLAVALESIGDVAVVSTLNNQIHPSFSITIQDTIRAKKMDTWGANILVYAVSGPPINCLKWAQGHVLPNILKWDVIDIVIAGINKGRNVGTDLLYSGTMSLACAAKFENESFMQSNARKKTPKAIAISLCPPSMDSSMSVASFVDFDFDFDDAVRAAIQITQLALRCEQTPNVVWNVNIPATPQRCSHDANGDGHIFKWAVTRPATLHYDGDNLITITKSEEKKEFHDFVINGPNAKGVNVDIDEEKGTDLCALKQNVISITAIELSPALHSPLHATNHLINIFRANHEKLFFCDTELFWNVNVSIRPLMSIVQCLEYWLRLKGNNSDKFDDTVLLQTYTLYLERDIKICASKHKFTNLLTQTFGWKTDLEKFNETLTWDKLTELYHVLRPLTQQQSSSLLMMPSRANMVIKGVAVTCAVVAMIASIAFIKRSAERKST